MRGKKLDCDRQAFAQQRTQNRTTHGRFRERLDGEPQFVRTVRSLQSGLAGTNHEIPLKSTDFRRMGGANSLQPRLRGGAIGIRTLATFLRRQASTFRELQIINNGQRISRQKMGWKSFRSVRFGFAVHANKRRTSCDSTAPGR